MKNETPLNSIDINEIILAIEYTLMVSFFPNYINFHVDEDNEFIIFVLSSNKHRDKVKFIKKVYELLEQFNNEQLKAIPILVQCYSNSEMEEVFMSQF